MFRIFHKIKILKAAIVSENTFRNEQTDPSVQSSFKCCHCSKYNKINIVPYQTGFPFSEIYKNEKVLTAHEILDNGLATKTSDWAVYMGDFTIDNLPTLYFGVDCNFCNAKHIVVFSFGEKQPGLEICEISGVWEFGSAHS